MKESTRKVVRAIETSDIIQVFLQKQIVDEPLEYIKRISSEASANYPLYFYIKQSNSSISNVISIVKSTTVRGNGKEKLIQRLEGKVIESKKLTLLKTNAAKRKNEYRLYWLSETIPEIIDHINYCVESIFYLSSQEIREHHQYICNTMLRIFKSEYEQAPADPCF